MYRKWECCAPFRRGHVEEVSVFNKFFWLSIHASAAKIQPDKFERWCQNGDFCVKAYFHTWCGLSANLECTSEMCCTRLAGNTGRKKSQFWHHRIILSGCIFAADAYIDDRKKNLLNIDTFPTCPLNIVNVGLVTAEICWRVWGTPANFNGFHVLAALLHGTLVVGVSQTLRR